MPIVVQAPQPPEEPLSASISVRVTATEKARVQAQAKALGTTVSALVRHWIEQNLGR